jgi:hypothetical protein
MILDIWLTWWAAGEDSTSGASLGYWLGIYALWGFIEIAGIGACCL